MKSINRVNKRDEKCKSGEIISDRKIPIWLTTEWQQGRKGFEKRNEDHDLIKYHAEKIFLLKNSK